MVDGDMVVVHVVVHDVVVHDVVVHDVVVGGMVVVRLTDANETGALTSRLASDTAKISNVVSFHVNILCR